MKTSIYYSAKTRNEKVSLISDGRHPIRQKSQLFEAENNPSVYLSSRQQSREHVFGLNPARNKVFSKPIATHNRIGSFNSDYFGHTTDRLWFYKLRVLHVIVIIRKIKWIHLSCLITNICSQIRNRKDRAKSLKVLKTGSNAHQEGEQYHGGRIMMTEKRRLTRNCSRKHRNSMRRSEIWSYSDSSYFNAK